MHHCSNCTNKNIRNHSWKRGPSSRQNDIWRNGKKYLNSWLDKRCTLCIVAKLINEGLQHKNKQKQYNVHIRKCSFIAQKRNKYFTLRQLFVISETPIVMNNRHVTSATNRNYFHQLQKATAFYTKKGAVSISLEDPSHIVLPSSKFITIPPSSQKMIN